MAIAVKVAEIWNGLSVSGKLTKASVSYFDKQVNTELSHFCMQVCRDSLLGDCIT